MKSNQPPSNIEIEKSLLASVILFPESLLEIPGELKPSDFFNKIHADLFGAVLEMSSKAIHIDAISAAASIENGPAIISSIIDTPLVTDIQWAADQIREKAVRRGLIQSSLKIQKMCHENDDFDELLAYAQQQFMAAEDSGACKGWFEADEIAGDIIQDVSGQTPISKIRSPFKRLNWKIGGFLPGDLVVVAGRPGMGKSALMVVMSMFFAGLGERSGIFSLEMSRIQIVQRILAILGRINLNEFKSQISGDLLKRLVSAGEKIEKAGILINDSGGLKCSEICRIARRMKRVKGISSVFVDYMQLVAGGRGQNRNDEIAEVSRAFKALAKELQITVFALSQLNRGLENREDKRPKLSDLRESGQIEQDADIVLFAYRESVYNKKANPRIGEIIIAKQRQGETGNVPVAWIPEFTEYANLEDI